jgi:hypothetical protein
MIRAQREARQARAVKEQEAADLKTRLDEAEAKLAKVSKADLLADPIGYAEAAGLSQADMILIGQAYLYQVAPDKAPPDLRYRMLEAKTRRERAAEERQRAQDQEANVARAQAQSVHQYQSAVQAAAESWESVGDQHPYQSSKAWFGGNPAEYAESLVYTARNIAAEASARGEVADLSIPAVAAILERDIAARASRFKSAAAAPTQSVKPQEPKVPGGGKQPAVLSTRGQANAPVPPAESEEERIKRAIAAAFGE